MVQDQTRYYVAELKVGLQTRTIVTPVPASMRPWQAVYLQSGSLRIDSSDELPAAASQSVEGPALVCWPADAECRLNLLAGSSGMHLALGEGFLVSVLGKRPEAFELREAVLELTVLPLAARPAEAERIRSAIWEIAHEHEAASAGQLLVIEAQLCCLLVHLWRHAHRIEDMSRKQGQKTILLRKFRQLLEARFHSRWRVRDYADALNVTADRLHNISTQELGKTPLALIHERSLREARALLTGTNMTLDQIAAHLGFKTTQQFSAFFRGLEGAPPGKYRSTAAARPDEALKDETIDLGDWP